jgi:hypothetical protein
MKILPVGADLFHADGQTDMKKLIVAFRILRTRLKSHEDTFTQINQSNPTYKTKQLRFKTNSTPTLNIFTVLLGQVVT